MKSTHTNNELTIKNIGESVKLRGWVSKVRDLGGLIFIDLRDREGITQVVVNPENKFYDLASKVRSEYVIYVEGEVVERESKNSKITTGEVEIVASYFEILNSASTTPIIIAEETDALEETRMKYRYLDIRRPNIFKFIKTKSDISSVIRKYFDELGFLDVETPILGKSTPEGARDFLVPSRMYAGEFYALPQSPQIYKQLLMIGGVEKYIQFARCFRDEDLRADRQLEFTQVDVEMSFADVEQIMEINNNLFKQLFDKFLNIKLSDEDFPIITYKEAMEKYGSDKPDIRFDLHISNFSNIFAKSEFQVFKNVLSSNDGTVRGIVVKNNADKFSRKVIDKLEKDVKSYGPKGLAWVKYTDNEFSGSVAKFLSDDEKSSIVNEFNIENNDIIFIIADSYDITLNSLGFLRLTLSKHLELVKDNTFAPLWVTDFPLFVFDKDDNRYYAAHHPFTSAIDEHKKLVKTSPGECIAKAYDFVINGYEIGGGSIRIHNQEEQDDMFEALGFSREEAYNQFGFFIDALNYGTPPHGGIAYGIERITMILTNTENIRDVVVFPKSQSARCPMMAAPSRVSDDQLNELDLLVKGDSNES